MNQLSTQNIVYAGLKCLHISNQNIEIIATTEVGPCILYFAQKGKKNLLISTPNLELTTPSGTKCPIYGGHRLWVAPETYDITYYPDNKPLEVTQSDNTITFSQTNYGQAFIKSISLLLLDTKLFLTHKIINNLPQKTACACWTITMLKAGGIAKIPMLNNSADEAGLQPTQQINLWKYTDIGGGAIELAKNEISVKANLTEGNLKIGTPESTGELTYEISGQTFTKSFEANYQATFDKMSKAEIFCCPNYIELEAIGEKHELAQGKTCSFAETWEIL